MLSTSITELLNKWLFFIQESLIPASCLLCQGQMPPGCALCRKCLGRQKAPHHRCFQCALAIPAHSHSLCGDCLSHQPPFSHSIAAFGYEPPWSTLIHRFKDQHDLASGRYLSLELAKQIRTSTLPLPDLMLPVPLHPSRMRRRGYNQSLEICRHLGRLLGLEAVSGALLCPGKADPQKHLGKKQRQGNLRKAFSVSDKAPQLLAGKRIAVVDDVMTTGSTAVVLASLLKQQGASEVYVWVLARTDRH